MRRSSRHTSLTYSLLGKNPYISVSFKIANIKMTTFGQIADRNYVENCVLSGRSHAWIAEEYKTYYPDVCGIR